MTDAIKKLVALLPEFEAEYNVAKDSFSEAAHIHFTKMATILAAIRDLEGVASGTHVIVPVEPLREKYQPCGCVLCTCEDDERCHGCGAKRCAKHEQERG